MVIVEGCDGSGKTTLCNKMRIDGLVKTVLESPARTRGNVPLVDQTYRYMAMHGRDHTYCVDRFLWSERVYGFLLRNKCNIPAKDYLLILSDIMLSGCPVIFCIPSKPADLKLDSEKQMPGVEENVVKIFEKYLEYYENVHDVYRKCFRYRWNDPNTYDQLAKKLRGEEPW